MTYCSGDPDIERVVAAELSLQDPAVREVRGQVAALLDPDFYEFGSSGRVWDRQSILDALATDDTPPAMTEGMVAPDWRRTSSC